MKKLISCSLLAVLFASCAAPLSYTEPRNIIVPHNVVMTQDFPFKEQVFTRFGSPTSKETYNNVENWYYRLGEITNSSSLGLSTGVGKIYVDPSKPELLSSNLQMGIVNSQTYSKETYVKFWFKNDTVVKWETFGVNFQREKPNDKFDEIAYQKALNERKSDNSELVFPSILFGLFATILLITN